MLLIDKPLEWTSFDVVNKIRYALKKALNIKKIKVGHAGTLDPLATGLLIICTGKATKMIEGLTGMDKTYAGTMVLGATRPSVDRETEINQEFPTAHLTENMLFDAAESLTGNLQQVPPLYSAKWVDGKRAYHYARAGKEKELTPHAVIVSEFALTHIALPEVDFRITCSKGTYIRSLVRDFGQSLDNGAFLQSLRRTAIGHFNIEEAETLEAFLSRLNAN